MYINRLTHPVYYAFSLKRSTHKAITPSPVTLHAVPKLSWAKYSAIIKATAPSLKPSIVVNKPSADITAPPGAPGAAIITTPNEPVE